MLRATVISLFAQQKYQVLSTTLHSHFQSFAVYLNSVSHRMCMCNNQDARILWSVYSKFLVDKIRKLDDSGKECCYSCVAMHTKP